MTGFKKKLIPILFILSGATGLVYETLWIRILSLGVGSTSQSMSLVLSIFFLGLSIGSFLSGKWARRIARPLYAYGLVELSLAICALLLVIPLLNMHSVMRLLPLSGSFSWIGNILKFSLVGLFLLAPTVLMGSTLPLLIRVFEKETYGSGKTISKLYALNTLGAVVGAYMTGYFLIPAFGITGSNLAAVGLNLLVAVTALKIGRDFKLPIDTSLKRISQDTKAFRFNSILFVTFMTGFVSIGFEVVWNKYLNIFFGTNLYGIGLVLALFLFGIALGSYILSLVIDSIKDKKAVLSYLSFLTLIALLTSTLVLNESPRLSVLSHYLFGSILSLVVLKTLVVSLILIIPTSLFGALFPLAIVVLNEGEKDSARTVGIAYSVNTVGAILGSYFTGMVLIPHLGSSITVQILIAAMGTLTLYLFVRNLGTLKLKTISVAAVSLVLVIDIGYVKTDFTNLIKSAYHQRAWKVGTGESKADALHALLKPFDKNYEEFKAIYEGETSVITLSHDPQDGTEYKNYLRLKTSGLNESVYNTLDLDELPKYEALIGFLPYLFSRAPKEAFVVGYGGGYTVDFLTSTDLRKVNVVELEKSILKAADYVYKGTNPITSRKNINLQIEDARFVLTTRQLPPQDIIVSQPSHSWLPGASNLFTKEFFEIVKDNLSQKGVFSQWLNLYNMDVEVLRSILKTFFSVFPEGAVFTQLEDQELVLLGSKTPLELNLKKMELIQQNPIFKKKLAQVFGNNSYDLLSLFSVSKADAVKLTEDAVINTDRNAYAEVRQSRIFYEGLKGRQTPQNYLSSIFNGDYSNILKGQDSPQFYYNLLVSMSQESQYDKFYATLDQYEKKAKSDLRSYSSLGTLALRAQRYHTAYEYLSQSIKSQPDSNTLTLLMNSLAEMNRGSEILALNKKYSSLRNKISDCYVLRSALQLGDKKEADRLEKVIAADISGYTNTCGAYVNKILGERYLEKGAIQTAIPFLEAYYYQWQSDVENIRNMILAYHKNQDPYNESQFREFLPKVIESERKRLQVLVDYYRRVGHIEDAEVLSAKIARLSTPIEALAE